MHPINGEPLITGNNKAVRQDWSKIETIDVILNREGKIKDIYEFTGTKKPLDYETVELKKTLNSFILSYSDERSGLKSSWLEKIRRTIYLYNLYGRIIIKKPKVCSFYYELLNKNTKNDGWVLANSKIEAEFIEMDENRPYNSEYLPRIVSEIIKMLYLNRLKQFMLRLLRNNLYLGNKAQKIKNHETDLCF